MLSEAEPRPRRVAVGEFDGVHLGHREVIRDNDTVLTFEPQFNGAYGEMKFLDEDLFADAEAGKVMTSWRCTLSIKGEPTSWRGLDLLHFKGDKLVQKLTYAKTKVPLFQS